MSSATQRIWAEFFAGGGMARAGLGAGWRCALANDFDPGKAAAHRAAWGADGFVLGDVAALAASDLPEALDLAWASSPCQNLSLAGRRAGLRADRSAAFWPWWALMKALMAEGRPPRAIAFENVTGLLTSSGGDDFAAVCEAFAGAGYAVGAMVVDAARFLPQSRPRLFVFALRDGPGAAPVAARPSPDWHPPALTAAVGRLPRAVRARWLWFAPPPPPPRTLRLIDILESAPQGVRWRTEAETEALLALMSPLHRAKIAAAAASGERRVGAIYRRTRPDGRGGRVQRAEIRFDDVAGCLRTPAGGSSRQMLLIVEGGARRARLLSPREALRLMGLPESYPAPPRATEAYRLAGDGVAAPVVSWLAREIIEPALDDARARAAA